MMGAHVLSIASCHCFEIQSRVADDEGMANMTFGAV